MGFSHPLPPLWPDTRSAGTTLTGRVALAILRVSCWIAGASIFVSVLVLAYAPFSPFPEEGLPLVPLALALALVAWLTGRLSFYIFTGR
jgi:hypothetical protein